MRFHELVGIPHRLNCHILSAQQLLTDADELAGDRQFPPLIRQRIKHATMLLTSCQALIATKHGRTRNGETHALDLHQR